MVCLKDVDVAGNDTKIFAVDICVTTTLKALESMHSLATVLDQRMQHTWLCGTKNTDMIRWHENGCLPRYSKSTYRQVLGPRVATGLRHECQQSSSVGKYAHDQDLCPDR